MNFILGCNYWASNAGTEMWKNWDEKAVNEDLKILSSHGVTHLRVFPNWRDFQPVFPLLTAGAVVREYRFENDVFPQNKYFLDETMLERFSVFCDICDKYNIKLIVGLLTGWMSGRTFIPSALFGKNLYTDPTALLFEQKFITGFVQRFKNRSTIYAWDLGNECNCMSNAGGSREVAANWTSIISNTIKANDNTRPVVSGMHSLSVDNTGWTLKDQGEFTDILTTHPYPLWVKYASKDEACSYRTTNHATCQTQLYSDIGGKPCLMEEIGTMGPMVCSDEKAADFFRCNMFSCYIHGFEGIMWWCANEQTNLSTAPYTWNMCEVELGMIYENRQPKPVLKELKKFSDTIKSFDFKLPSIKYDAVCILTQNQDHWGIAYMTYCLARQVGINIKFVFAEEEIPNADIYLMPSVSGNNVMPDENYKILTDRIEKGAKLYLSIDDAIISHFRHLTGNEVTDSYIANISDTLTLNNETISYSKNKAYIINPKNANVIAYNSENEPIITESSLGKGKVFFVNFPLEKMLINERRAFDKNKHLIYAEFFKDTVLKKAVRTENKYLSLTEHYNGDCKYVAVVNHSEKPQNPQLAFNGCEVEKVVYGDINCVNAFDALIFKVK